MNYIYYICVYVYNVPIYIMQITLNGNSNSVGLGAESNSCYIVVYVTNYYT